MSRGAADIVRAEAAEWMGDAVLSIGTLVGFAVAFGLQLSGYGHVAAYVDPVMVVLTSLIYLRIPLRLFGEGLHEVLTMSAGPAVREQVERLAIYLWNLGRPCDAFTVAQEAIAIYTKLVAADPERHEEELAQASHVYVRAGVDGGCDLTGPQRTAEQP